MLCSAAMDEAMDDTNLIGYEIYELPWKTPKITNN